MSTYRTPPLHAGNTYLSNGQSLEDFLHNYGTDCPTSFYEGKQFMKLLEEAERKACTLGSHVAEDFYAVVSGRQACRRLTNSVEYTNTLQKRITELNKNIWELTPPEKQFRLLLERHDWYYSYSDDGSVWRAGEEQWNKILGMVKEHPEFQTILNNFRTERKL